SPMDTVTGLEMAKALTEFGCLGILNRFDTSLEKLVKNKNKNSAIKAVSIALNSSLDIVEKLAEKDYIICIDTANANNNEVLRKTEEIKKKFKVKIIVGNIA